MSYIAKGSFEEAAEAPTKPTNEAPKRENGRFGVTIGRLELPRKRLLSIVCIDSVLRDSKEETIYSKVSRYSKTASNLVAISGSSATRLASQ